MVRRVAKCVQQRSGTWRLLLGCFLGCFLALRLKYRPKQAAMHRPRALTASTNFEVQPIFQRPEPMLGTPERSLQSGRAAHIGLAAADHALCRGLGIRLGRGGAGAIFEVGHDSRFATPEP